MSGRLRHWKQHWDPDAPLVFTKRMRLAQGFVNAGDDVTPEIIKELGPHAKHRLKRWWEARCVAIKDWQAPSDIRRERAERVVPQADLEPLGKGWYAVRDAAGVVTKVRGLKAANELLEKMHARTEDEQPPQDPIVDDQPAGEVIVGDQPEVPTIAAEGEQPPQE